jgi:hypothetical protein
MAYLILQADKSGATLERAAPFFVFRNRHGVASLWLAH